LSVPFPRLITLQPSLQEAFVSSDRLGEIIDLPLEDEKEEGAAELTEVKGDIEIKDLSFSYGTRGDTIKNVSLKINAGEKIAFVGPSGSGKSTLVKLILKFFLFERGEITLDGQKPQGHQDVLAAEQHRLRSTGNPTLQRDHPGEHRIGFQEGQSTGDPQGIHRG
jgi:ABC-type bacteriocin/lantibiotic exporter with double-glycine peptidase domain